MLDAQTTRRYLRHPRILRCPCYHGLFYGDRLVDSDLYVLSRAYIGDTELTFATCSPNWYAPPSSSDGLDVDILINPSRHGILARQDLLQRRLRRHSRLIAHGWDARDLKQLGSHEQHDCAELSARLATGSGSFFAFFT